MARYGTPPSSRPQTTYAKLPVLTTRVPWTADGGDRAGGNITTNTQDGITHCTLRQWRQWWQRRHSGGGGGGGPGSPAVAETQLAFRNGEDEWPRHTLQHRA